MPILLTQVIFQQCLKISPFLSWGWIPEILWICYSWIVKLWSRATVKLWIREIVNSWNCELVNCELFLTMSKHFTIPWPHRPQSRERKQSGGRRSTCVIISLLVGLLFLLKVSERMSCLHLQIWPIDILPKDKDLFTKNLKFRTFLINDGKNLLRQHKT